MNAVNKNWELSGKFLEIMGRACIKYQGLNDITYEDYVTNLNDICDFDFFGNLITIGCPSLTNGELKEAHKFADEHGAKIKFGNANGSILVLNFGDVDFSREEIEANFEINKEYHPELKRKEWDASREYFSKI